MYEGKIGAYRLINVLERYSYDSDVVEVMAKVLNYDEEQLLDDVKALVELIQESSDRN